MTTPISELLKDKELEGLLEAVAKVTERYRPPVTNERLEDLVPSTLRRHVEGVVSHFYIPDEHFLYRLFDHPLIDDLLGDFVTRLIAGYAAQLGSSRPSPSRGLLARVPLKSVTSGLSESVAAGVSSFAHNNHSAVVSYLVDTLTSANRMPGFASWRRHLVSVIWEMPLDSALPFKEKRDSSWAQQTLEEIARTTREELGSQSLLDVLETLGFERGSVLDLARVLQDILSVEPEPGERHKTSSKRP